MKKYKVMFTGGHVTPALAVIDELQKKDPSIEIVFVGRKYNNNEKTESFEYHEVTTRGIRFIHLETGRSLKSLSLESLRNLVTIPQGMWRAWKMVDQEKPDLIMSFGGYIAMPITSAAYIRNIPIFTHEQTIHPGVANQSIAGRAAKVFTAFPEAASFFPASKVVVSGNPIRAQIFQVRNKIEHTEPLPTIYVTGGSLGAHAVNVLVEHILPDLLKHTYVIHQTGNVEEFRDFERLTGLKFSLQPELQARYDIRTHVTDEEIGAVFACADLVIGRSGANTFFELVALKKPVISIPLPEAAFDEQRKHAQILEDAGVGEIFEQDQDPAELLSMILNALKHRNDYEDSYITLTKRYKTKEAAGIIVDAIVAQKNS